jgi:hypothetical protein
MNGGGVRRRRTLTRVLVHGLGARKTPTCSTRSDEAARGGGGGGDAAARADNAAARLGYSGEVARAPRCSGSTTNGAGV